MSIPSEYCAEAKAKDYEKILIEIVNEARFETYDNIYPKKLAWFAKKHIYPIYISTLNDAWREKPTPEQERIEKFFKNY